MLEILVDDVLDLDPLHIEVSLPLLGLPPERERFFTVRGQQLSDAHKLATLDHAVEQKHWSTLFLGLLEFLGQFLIIFLARSPDAILDTLKQCVVVDTLWISSSLLERMTKVYACSKSDALNALMPTNEGKTFSRSSLLM